MRIKRMQRCREELEEQRLWQNAFAYSSLYTWYLFYPCLHIFQTLSLFVSSFFPFLSILFSPYALDLDFHLKKNLYFSGLRFYISLSKRYDYFNDFDLDLEFDSDFENFNVVKKYYE